MFEHNMRENYAGVVHVPDFSLDVVQDMVQFVYSGLAPNLEKHSLELFAIADKVSILSNCMETDSVRPVRYVVQKVAEFLSLL